MRVAWRTYGLGGMSDADDATDDGGRRVDVVTVTAVAAEPEQDQQDRDKERTAERDDRHQPRVVEV